MAQFSILSARAAAVERLTPPPTKYSASSQSAQAMETFPFPFPFLPTFTIVSRFIRGSFSSVLKWT
jgi:hypothetical protein